MTPLSAPSHRRNRWSMRAAAAVLALSSLALTSGPAFAATTTAPTPPAADRTASVHQQTQDQQRALINFGTVKWFNSQKGYGFIVPDDGSQDVFVHYSNIIGVGYRTLNEGERVEYQLRQGPKGPEAVNVLRLGPLLQIV